MSSTKPIVLAKSELKSKTNAYVQCATFLNKYAHFKSSDKAYVKVKSWILFAISSLSDLWSKWDCFTIWRYSCSWKPLLIFTSIVFLFSWRGKPNKWEKIKKNKLIIKKKNSKINFWKFQFQNKRFCVHAWGQVCSLLLTANREKNSKFFI